MTREEQITFKAGSIADGCIAHGAPWEDYYQGFIEGAKWADANPSKPSLPSNLDEAAVEWCKINNKGIALCADKKSHYLAEGVDAFIAGAEWMEKEINKELIKAAEKVHEIRDIDYDIHVDTSAIGSFETTSYYENGKLVGQERSKKEE